MLTSSNFISSITEPKVLPAHTVRSAATNQIAQRYDSVSISGRSGSKDPSFMGMVSRIAQEVRTSTTTADIRQLRQAVQSGSYAPDPCEIARKMLFLGEA